MWCLKMAGTGFLTLFRWPIDTVSGVVGVDHLGFPFFECFPGFQTFCLNSWLLGHGNICLPQVPVKSMLPWLTTPYTSTTSLHWGNLGPGTWNLGSSRMLQVAQCPPLPV